MRDPLGGNLSFSSILTNHVINSYKIIILRIDEIALCREYNLTFVSIVRSEFLIERSMLVTKLFT